MTSQWTPTWHILDSMPYGKIQTCCDASPLLAIECNKPEYWRHRIEMHFNLTSVSDNPREEYLKYLSVGECTYGSEKYRDIVECVNEAVENQDKDLVEYYVNYILGSGRLTDANKVIADLAFGNHRALLASLLEKFPDVDVNQAVEGAAFGGHEKLTETLINLFGADAGIAIEASARGGRGLLMMQLIDSETKMGSMSEKMFNDALTGAALEGHGLIVMKLIEMVPGFGFKPDLDAALVAAAFGGHRELVFGLIELGATNIRDASLGARKWGHMELADELMRMIGE